MGLANFFDKAALAAAQLLRDFDRTAFARRLEAAPVLLAFDAAACQNVEGRCTIDLLARLLGRLYPVVVVHPLDVTASATVNPVQQLLRDINPAISLPSEVNCRAAIVVGSTPLTANGVARETPVLYVGSDNWLVTLSQAGPVGSGTSGNPFGAGAAACLGAANVFRAVFHDMLPNGQLDTEVRLSLLTYEQGTGSLANPAWPQLIQLRETVLVGLGAVGNGTIWALSQLRHAQGVLHLVDHEAVDLTNLQRYVLTTQIDQGRRKVELASVHVASSGIRPVPHVGNWAAYMQQALGKEPLPRVAVAVDNAAGRIAIQAALPPHVLNAWTQPENLGVSRHPKFGESTCLACLYMPRGKRKSESELYAEALGLPELEVRERLYFNASVDPALAARIAAACGLPIERLLPFIGKPIRTFYQETVCGGIILHTAQGQVVDTPMAFQSALAGIMLAVELIAEDANLRAQPLPTTTRIDLLQPLGTYLHVSVRPAPAGRCLCTDKHYRNAFNAAYQQSQEVGVA